MDVGLCLYLWNKSAARCVCASSARSRKYGEVTSRYAYPTTLTFLLLLLLLNLSLFFKHHSASTLDVFHAQESSSSYWADVRKNGLKIKRVVVGEQKEEGEKAKERSRTNPTGLRGAPISTPKSMYSVMAGDRITMKSLAKFGFCLTILLTSVAGKCLINTYILLRFVFEKERKKARCACHKYLMLSFWLLLSG